MAQEISQIKVDILDVSRSLYSGPALSLTAPAALGEVCILPRHAPMLTKLNTGEVRLRTQDGGLQFFFVAGGFLEVSDSSVTVLADQTMRSEEIDEAAAVAARQQAEEMLGTSLLFTDRDRAQIALVEALVKLRILEHSRMKHGKS